MIETGEGTYPEMENNTPFIPFPEVVVYDPRPLTPLQTLLLISACVAAMSMVDPASLHAQESAADAQRERFAELVNQAKTAYQSDDYATAITYLQQAYFIDNNPALLFNIARAYEKMEQCGKATAYYKAVLRIPDIGEQVAERAKEGLATQEGCEAYDPSASGRVVIQTEPSDARIFIDGTSLGNAPVEAIMLPAGIHRLKIEKEGYKTIEEKITLDAETDIRIDRDLLEASPEPKPSTPSPSVTDEMREKDSGGDVNIPAIAIASGGVIGLGVGLYFDLVAIPNLDDERAQFQPSDPEYADLTEDREGLARNALIGYIAGGALLAAGGGWLIYDLVTADKKEDADADARALHQLRITPVVGPERTGVFFEARF